MRQRRGTLRLTDEPSGLEPEAAVTTLSFELVVCYICVFGAWKCVERGGWSWCWAVLLVAMAACAALLFKKTYVRERRFLNPPKQTPLRLVR